MTNPAWPLPPIAQLSDFLSPPEHSALLSWVLANEHTFKPAKVLGDSAKGEVDRDIRVGLTSRDLGPHRPMIERRLRDALPELARRTGAKPGATSIELEFAAHGDGAHYKPHVDIATGPGRRVVGASPGEDRILSAVYYFYREPKGFSGGTLRLFRFNVRPSSDAFNADDCVELEPVQNSLIAFPPWATHEVAPVHCLSKLFGDYRFAMNCWFCRKL